MQMLTANRGGNPTLIVALLGALLAVVILPLSGILMLPAAAPAPAPQVKIPVPTNGYISVYASGKGLSLQWSDDVNCRGGINIHGGSIGLGPTLPGEKPCGYEHLRRNITDLKDIFSKSFWDELGEQLLTKFDTTYAPSPPPVP